MSAPKASVTTSPRVRWQSALVLCAVIAGLWFALRQSEELTFARRNLPPSCIQALADMNLGDARARGVALRDCASRKMRPDSRASVIGRWSYGPPDAQVDGFVVWLRETRGEGIVHDRLMHVTVIESNAVLNDFDVTGMGCAGGIKTVNLDGNNLGLVINLTPEALARFTSLPDVEQTYKTGDLMTDPRYCVAKLVLSNRRAVVIQLNDKPVTATDAAVPLELSALVSPRQQCLDGLIARRVLKGDNALAYPQGYDAFMKQYVAQCVAQ